MSDDALINEKSCARLGEVLTHASLGGTGDDCEAFRHGTRSFLEACVCEMRLSLEDQSYLACPGNMSINRKNQATRRCWRCSDSKKRGKST